jgi:hypothetical protein
VAATENPTCEEIAVEFLSSLHLRFQCHFFKLSYFETFTFPEGITDAYLKGKDCLGDGDNITIYFMQIGRNCIKLAEDKKEGQGFVNTVIEFVI